MYSRGATLIHRREVSAACLLLLLHVCFSCRCSVRHSGFNRFLSTSSLCAYLDTNISMAIYVCLHVTKYLHPVLRASIAWIPVPGVCPRTCGFALRICDPSACEHPSVCDPANISRLRSSCPLRSICKQVLLPGSHPPRLSGSSFACVISASSV